jgi:signal transduction histidine kinase
MRLSDFIIAHSHDILMSWMAFVRGSVVAASHLEDADLRGHAAPILAALSPALTAGVSQAQRVTHVQAVESLEAAARAHAMNRVRQGFTLDQIMAEFGHVRSDVARRWTGEIQDFGRESHHDQLQFNDLLDRAMAVSTAHYAMRLELARDLFLGVLGHDLRTPLAAIAHSAVLLQRGDASDDQRIEAVERIAKSARRMDLMIQDLLDFTRSRLGTQLPMNPSPCNLEAIARQTMDELTAFHPGTTVRVNASGDLDGIWDSERLIQLLSNLVDNAIRHRTGSEPVTVELRGDEDRVEISVHNVGQVIVPSEQKAIFDPLRRGIHQTQGQPPPIGTAGLGLGLYIAEQIAVAHGGGIELTSTVAEGTRFTATVARAAASGSGHP